MTDHERLMEIETRAAKATEGPLEIMRYDHGGGRMGFFGDPHKGEKRGLVADFYQEDDREFYYEARSDIPYLLAQLRTAMEENARLREALAMYGKHSRSCNSNTNRGRIYGGACDCGLDASRATLNPPEDSTGEVG